MSIKRGDDKWYQILTNATATGTAFTVPGGEYSFGVSGTWTGTVTVALQMQLPDGNWGGVQVFNASPVAFTAPGVQVQIDLPACVIRAALSAAPTTGSINCYLIGQG